MRLVAVTTLAVGGLADGRIELPESPLAAFAGGNGTGKSKLLACLLSVWAGQIPAAGAPTLQAVVDVEVRFTAQERDAFERFSDDVGWGAISVPESVTIRTSSHPTAGTQRSSIPPGNVLVHAWMQPAFMQTQPSLNVVYLPAERRLVASGSAAIDLNELSEIIAWQKTAEPRSAVQAYGRLDDQEFEGFAKALCVAATLPDEQGHDADAARSSRIQWEEFQTTVNTLIAPKVLLPLTRQHPEQLRIQTPAGATHAVQDLSSGERQALIIISRVLRAGAGHALVLIDEPDAYLHPHLSQRLVQALEQGVGHAGQLVVATHSPAILDSLTPSTILRLSHDARPRLVADEVERIELYRSAGFRASTLTQADLLLIVEGETDGPLLTLLCPELSRVAITEAGGRPRVLREVEQLAPYELPVLGVVDRDVLAPDPPASVSQLVTVWPVGDLEAVFLSDDVALEVMIARGLAKRDVASVDALRQILADLVEGQRDNVIAELAQRQLRGTLAWEWPSPKGHRPIERLREATGALAAPSEQQVADAIREARAVWEEHAATDPWRLVRGKSLAKEFASKASEMRSGRALLDAIARERPALRGLEEFRRKLADGLN